MMLRQMNKSHLIQRLVKLKEIMMKIQGTLGSINKFLSQLFQTQASIPPPGKYKYKEIYVVDGECVGTLAEPISRAFVGRPSRKYMSFPNHKMWPPLGDLSAYAQMIKAQFLQPVSHIHKNLIQLKYNKFKVKLVYREYEWPHPEKIHFLIMVDDVQFIEQLELYATQKGGSSNYDIKGAKYILLPLTNANHK